MTVSQSDTARLARPGRNCSVVARAGRLGLAVDAEAYYRALAHALRRARRSILVVGWEFDSRTDLVREDSGQRGEEIGALLNKVVRERPALTAHVLIWDTALIYAVNREIFGLVRMNWLTPRRLHFCLDDSHPLGASHHQKIVVIDDALAFVGGLDVSSQRWDTRAHALGDHRRSDPGADGYPPFHDMMAVVTGEAARALGDICRERWHTATGRQPRPVPAGDPDELWPPGIEPLLAGVEVALARTSPAWDGREDLREVETLYVDMIAAARRFIYIENQYFASRRVTEAIEARLARGDCPEIVVVNPGEPVSLVERSTMGVARARLYRRLMEADPARRLRIYYPLSGGREVKVHSKLMIVDDLLLRVGSANLNNRSMGLDTECDLLLEAAGDPRVAEAVRRVRLDLLAEHLGVRPEAVADAEAAAGGMHAAIALLAGGERTLVELGAVDPSNVVQMIADSGIPDPEEPVETLVWIEEAMPEPAKRPLQLRVWALAGVLAA
ncbi:MAG: phospholipase D-like domain-containing protein, partial [Pseudomonadota bacterium]